jgi:hypothetical protein
MAGNVALLSHNEMIFQAMSIAGQWLGGGQERCVSILLGCCRWRNSYFLRHLASFQCNYRPVSIVEHLQIFYKIF